MLACHKEGLSNTAHKSCFIDCFFVKSPLSPQLRFVVHVPARSATLWVSRISQAPIRAQSPPQRSPPCHPLPCPLSMESELSDSCLQRQPPVSEHGRWGQDLRLSGPIQPTVEKPVGWARSPPCALLVLWCFGFRFFFCSQSLFSWEARAQTKTKTGFLWEYSLTRLLLSGVCVSGLLGFYFVRCKWLIPLTLEGSVLWKN